MPAFPLGQLSDWTSIRRTRANPADEIKLTSNQRDRLLVQIWRKSTQPNLVKCGPGIEKPVSPADQDHPGIEILTSFDSWHDADDRILKRDSFEHVPPPPQTPMTRRVSG